MIVILFGVSGAGKTTIGKKLAKELDWQFIEADDFHSEANIDKMRKGLPLTDEDRWPWLEKLRQLIGRSLARGDNAVIACSALKDSYRRVLGVSDKVKFVFLRGSYDLIAAQLRNRRGHFMNPTLLQSQFDALEEPRPAQNVIVIELGRSPTKLVEAIRSKLLPV